MRRIYKLTLMLLALAAACSLLSGCGPDARQARAMRQITPQQRREAFASMPPEKQLDVYLISAGGEPGHIFSYDLASNWKSVLPVLKQRLSSQRGEAERVQLLWLLAAISENYCSLAERKDVLDAASRAVASMGASSKQYAQEPLRRVIHPTKQLPPCQ
jgi:hypothetical protein